MLQLRVNGDLHEIDVDPSTPLVWVLRDHLGLKGTKFGCGVGQCGACTIHLNGFPVRTCIFPVAGAVDAEIRTIEGLDHPVQAAWLAEQVPQCGWCQGGQLLTAAALLDANPSPTRADIDRQMNVLCRCATYPRIRKAIARAAAALASPEDDAGGEP